MTRFQPRLPQGYRLVSFDSIGSTNDEAKRLARDGAADGSVIWAREQTSGRGRRGRPWISPRGNLYSSLILRPNCPPNQAAQLGFVAALAVGSALATIIPAFDGPSYKWPNDVLINGRKLAGILLESEMTAPGRLSFLVIGIGVNLMVSPEGSEFPATSLRQEGLGAVTPELMLEESVRCFHLWHARWHVEGFAPVRAAWLARAATAPGAEIRVRLEATELRGRFLDIDNQGALLLDIAGENRLIPAGEIFPTQH